MSGREPSVGTETAQPDAVRTAAPSEGKLPDEDAWGALRRAGVFLEKAKLAQWVDIMNDPRRNFWVNFWAGVARGMGMVVGAFLVGVVFAFFSAHLLRKAFEHAGGVPWVGGEMREAIGFIIRVAREYHGGALSVDPLFTTALLAVFAADWGSKALIQARFFLGESLTLAPGLAFTYVRNTGAAFSLLAGAPSWWRRPFFYGVALAACGGALWMLRGIERRDRLSRLALGLVVGGALGNLLDRVRLGEVVDFIEVGVRGVYTWPVFNVADSAVCVGIGLLLWRTLKPLPPLPPPSGA